MRTLAFVGYILLCLTASSGTCYAGCTVKERIELSKAGYSKEEIEDICNSEGESKESSTTKPKEQRLKQYDSYPTLTPYCCDAFGNKRCMTNPGPIGSSCFCYGQGWGYACQ